MEEYYALWVHQIKTPISAMRLLLQREEQKQTDPDETAGMEKSVLYDMQQELFWINQYVNMALQYQRMNSGMNDLVLEMVSADQVVRTAIRRFALIMIRKKIAIHYEECREMVLSDEKWLEFVVEQILSNAIKYSGENRAVTIQINRNEADNTCELVISDQGIGIRKEDGVIKTETNLPFVPDGEGNLAWRAAKLLLDEAGIKDGVTIRIRKYIPVAAGMAGGSTDAAAVLVGVNRMFDLGFTKKELMERGVKLGADVPYCIMRGTALSEGIGEILTELPPSPKCHLVIAKPQISVSTKAVYGKLRVNELAPEEHPDIDGMTEAIRNGDLDGVISRLGNVLETVTIPDHPEIARIKSMMMENGACGSLMSGSGPTVFGIYKDRKLAEKTCQVLKEADDGRLTRQVYLTEFYNRKKAR